MKIKFNSFFVIFLLLLVLSTKQNFSVINDFRKYFNHNLGIIIHPPVPRQPEITYPPILLNNIEPYPAEDIEIMGDSILSLAHEFDSNANHLSSCDNFDTVNDEFSVLTDANTFIDVFEDNTYPNLANKILKLKSISINNEFQTFEQDQYVVQNNQSQSSGPINLHILVPGIGGMATDFSNNGSTSQNSSYLLQKASIPAKIAEKFSSSVYIVSANQNGTYQLFTYNTNDGGGTKQPVDGHFTNPLTYNFSNNDVLVYEDANNCESSNNLFYYPFSNFLNRIYLRMSGGKFNLYGHSRGGLINLMYSTANPNKVNKMFSFGTPYFSPALSSLYTFVTNLPSENNPVVSNLQNYVSRQFNSCNDAFTDLSNSSLLESYRTQWNALNQNDIDFTAIGYTVPITFVSYIKILFFKIGIVHNVTLGFDGLVGEGNARGKLYNFNEYDIIPGLNIPIPLPNSDDSSISLHTTRTLTIDIPLEYALAVIGNQNNKFKLSEPFNPAVSHNLELMYPTTINYVNTLL